MQHKPYVRSPSLAFFATAVSRASSIGINILPNRANHARPPNTRSLCYLRLRQLMKEDTCVLCKTVMDRVMVCTEENIRWVRSHHRVHEILTPTSYTTNYMCYRSGLYVRPHEVLPFKHASRKYLRVDDQG